MTADGVWWVVTGLLQASARKDPTRTGLTSAVPMLWLAPLGGGALACAVLMVATAMLEPGRPGRSSLLTGTFLPGLARWLDAHDLTVWVALGRVHLGGDVGSLLIAVVGLLLGGLGVGALCRGVVDRLTVR